MMMARIPEKPIKSPFERQRNHGPDVIQEEQQGIDAVIASRMDEEIENITAYGASR